MGDPASATLQPALPDVPAWSGIASSATSPESKQLSYAFPVRHAVPGSAGAVAIGDVTGDGAPDIVVAVGTSSEGLASIYSRKTDGSFELVRSYGLQAAYAHLNGGIVLADLNRDGTQDIAIGTSDGITLLTSNGTNGATLKRVSTGQAMNQLAAMDVDLDGRMDLVGMTWGNIMGSYMPDASRIFFGDGDGGVSAMQSLATPQRGYNDLKVGDVTGDGFKDLVIVSGQAFDFWVVPHDGVAGFLAPRAYPSPGQSWKSNAVAIADVNGDGRRDVIVNEPANKPYGALWIHLQQAGGALGQPSRMDAWEVPGPMVGTDLNGDGKDDVAVVHEGWGQMGVFLQTASRVLAAPTFWPVVGLYAQGADRYNRQGMAAGDFTGDQCPDVALGDYNYGLVILQGADCRPPRTMSTPLPPELL